MRWAVTDESNIVVEIVEQEERPARAIAIGADPDVRLGLYWTGGEFRPQRFTAYQFVNRFTEAELELIRSRAVSDSIVWRFLTLATSAHEIDTADPVTITGMDYLVQVAIITNKRRGEILAL